MPVLLLPRSADPVAVGTLVDNFDDNVVDTVKWPSNYGTVSEVGGRARTQVNTGYNAYSSAARYSLTGSQALVRVYPMVQGGATTECWMQLLIQTTTAGTDVIMEYDAINNVLRMSNRVGYSDAGAVTLAWDPVAYAWWRIRESGGTLYWDTAPDGLTWTNRRSITTPSWAGAGNLNLQLISHRSDGTADYAEWDNFNVVAWAQTPSDNVGVTDTAASSIGYGRTQADAVGLTDSASVVKGFDNAYADAVGVTDSIATAQDYRPSVTDAENVTDSIATVYQGQRTLADSENVTDSTVISHGFGVVPADAENLTDTTGLSQGYGRLPADTEGLTDSIAIKYDGIRTPADNENVTDAVAVSGSYVKPDNVGLTDSVTFTQTTIPVVPPSTRPMVGLCIKLFDPAPSALFDLAPMGAGGDVVSIAPDLKAVSWTDELSKTGTISIEYPADGVNFALLTADRAEGAVFWGSLEIPGTRFLVSEQSRDVLDEQGGTVKINAPAFVSKRLSEAVVHPPNWPTSATPFKQTFSSATPGGLMLALINQAVARGALLNLEWDFTALVDSHGNAWSQVVNLDINVGDNYQSVLSKLVDMAVCDWRGDGRKLQMYNWDTMGTDHSTGTTPVILYAGRDIEDAPENRSVLNLANVILSVGEEGSANEVSDSGSVTTFGRIEGYVSTQGVKDWPTLGLIAGATLNKSKHAQEEYTHNLTWADATSPVPYIDYRVADKVLRSVNGTVDAYVVRQMTFSMDANGDLKSTVTLNDKFYSYDVLQERRLNALTGGSSSESSAPADNTTDKVPPNAATSLLVTSAAYVGNGGVTYAAISATWTQPTTNTDGSTLTDLDHYEVQWKYSTDTTWAAAGSTGGNVLQWSGVLPGRNIDVRVQAVDQNNNRSAWSATTTVLTAADSTAPPQPSTPVVSNYLGVLRVAWDGLTAAAGAQPSDFAGAEVHVSTTNGFTPSTATKVDTLPGAGVSVISALNGGTALVYGTTYYVKLVSYDRSGNASTPSAQGSASPSQVVATDISTGAVGLANTRFSDIGSLVDDGSFENAAVRTTRSALISGTGMSFDNSTASNGTWSLKSALVSGGPSQSFTLQAGLPVKPGETIFGACDIKGDATATGSVNFDIQWYNAAGQQIDATGAVAATNYILAGTANTTLDGTWKQRVTNIARVAPPNVVTFNLILFTTGRTVGNVWIDALECRRQVDTLLVNDAAITNAKIANLAVNNAKISDLSVAKLTAGTLAADVVVGSRIKTADTGSRVELNSGGIGAWNAGGTQTVAIAAADGSVTIIGQLKSGTTGKRIEINPTSTYLPEIRFYPDSGTNYGFLNGFSPTSSAAVYIGLNSGSFTANSQTSVYRLYMTDVNCSLETIRQDTQATLGGYMRIDPSSATLGAITTTERQGYVDVMAGGGAGTHVLGLSLGHNGTSDNDDAFFNVYKDGSYDMVGTWVRSVGWANSAVQCNTDSSSSTIAGFNELWGTTQNSTIYPSCQYRDNPGVGTAVDTLTTSGFGFNIAGGSNGACALNWWGWR